MYNWFECKVRYTKIDEHSGKEKKVTEPYLVDAVSFTEAEARFTEELEKIVSEEFAITNISKSKIADVFFYEEGDYWYKCKVSILDVDEKSGKEKKTANMMLVPADTVKEAYERIEESLASVVAPWEINAITQSPIVELFPFLKDEETNEEIPDNLKKLSELLAGAVEDDSEQLDIKEPVVDSEFDEEEEEDDFASEFADEDEFSEDAGFSIDDGAGLSDPNTEY